MTDDGSDSEILSLLSQLEVLVNQMNVHDLPTLVNLFPIIDKINCCDKIPSAFVAKTCRIKEDIEAAIMGETVLESVLPGIKHGLFTAISCLSPSTNVVAEKKSSPMKSLPEKEPSSKSEITVEVDLDLVRKFCDEQQNHLEDLEIYALEWEKGCAQALPEIKRYLHTLKGEFGVLNYPQLANLIHIVEDALDQDKFSADYLLRLKDYLSIVMQLL